VAIAVESALPDQFSPEDSILFYAQATQSKYTSENIYWLTFGNEVGLRMDAVDGRQMKRQLQKHTQPRYITRQTPITFLHSSAR
jgi:hypothetical protein